MSRTKVCFATCLMLVCGIATVVPASAQHFKQMDGSLTQIAVGRAEVWGLNGTEVYRFDSSTEKFNKMSGSLAQIAVGGGSLLQRDEVWGVSASGAVYQFNFSKNKFETIPGNLTQIAVGEGNADTVNPDNCHPYEVWGIGYAPNLVGNVWRYNFCISRFENIQNPHGPAVLVTQLAVGENNIWVLDETSYPSEYMNGGWYSNSAWPELQQITVGVDEDVWGIRPVDGGTLYRYSPDSSFEQICVVACQGGGAPPPVQVEAGGEGAWIVYFNEPNLEIARYKNLGGQQPIVQGSVFSWFAGTGSIVQVAVGSGGGVWVITRHLAADFGYSYHVWAFVRP